MLKRDEAKKSPADAIAKVSSGSEIDDRQHQRRREYISTIAAGESAILRTMIYLDNNATTQVASEVFEAMAPFLTSHYGNPSSAHALGQSSRAAVEQAREGVAGVRSEEHTSELQSRSDLVC